MSAKGPIKLRRLAIAWLRESDWPAWLAMDSGFQPDYQHWLQRMETTFARLEGAGVPVVKVTLDPDEFLAWSKATGAGVDTHARAKYAAFAAMRMDLN